MGKREDRGRRGLFEYRGQWIDCEPGRGGYYRYWYDQRSRRVKRKALNEHSLSAAKERLISLLSQTGISAQAPERVSLADVLAHYVEHHAAGRGYSAMANARRAAQLALKSLLVQEEHPTVSILTRTNQRRIWGHMAEKENLSPKSISTYMISVRAAVNYAAKPQIIEVEDPDRPGQTREEEVQYLERTVPVFCDEAEIAEHVGRPMSEPREFIPTVNQLAKWIDAIEEEDDFRYVVIALNTWARNEAIFDLRLSNQVNFEFGLLDLNPPGRRQTKKRRPVIRLTTALAAWLEHWRETDAAANSAEYERARQSNAGHPTRLIDVDRPVRQYQDTVEKRINAIGKKIGLPEMTCYTIRHFMATHARRTSFEVSKEQRSLWLGHTVKSGSRTTDWYEKFDPDYLESPMRATEEIIKKVDAKTTKSLLAPTMLPHSRVRLIEGGKY